MIVRLLLAWLAAGLLLISNSAAAQENAETLFQDALTKMKEGRFAEACPMLARSQQLEAKSGTLISLGFCRERIGKTAGAWRAYREAATLAADEGRDDYVEKATGLAASLEPKLSRYRIDAAPTPGLEVRVDGQLISTEALGEEVAIDPGRLTVVATAPAHETWTQYVDIEAPGTKVIEVPRLTKTPSRAAPTPPQRLPPPPPPEPRTLSIVGWTLTGVGAAGSVVGFVLGGLVLDRKATVDEECTPSTRTCSQAGLDASEQGSDFALGSTIAVVGGLALLATGVTLVLVDELDQERELALQASPLPGGAALGLEVSF